MEGRAGQGWHGFGWEAIQQPSIIPSSPSPSPPLLNLLISLISQYTRSLYPFLAIHVPCNSIGFFPPTLHPRRGRECTHRRQSPRRYAQRCSPPLSSTPTKRRLFVSPTLSSTSLISPVSSFSAYSRSLNCLILKLSHPYYPNSCLGGPR